MYFCTLLRFACCLTGSLQALDAPMVQCSACFPGNQRSVWGVHVRMASGTQSEGTFSFLYTGYPLLQSGPLSALAFLAEDLARLHNYPDLAVHFLMPCHSTPLYSHLHVPVPTWVLNCAPQTFMRKGDGSVALLSGVRNTSIQTFQSRDYTHSAAFESDPALFVHAAYQGEGECAVCFTFVCLGDNKSNV
jgi:hypothetical protein